MNTVALVLALAVAVLFLDAKSSRDKLTASESALSVAQAKVNEVNEFEAKSTARESAMQRQIDELRRQVAERPLASPAAPVVQTPPVPPAPAKPSWIQDRIAGASNPLDKPPAQVPKSKKVYIGADGNAHEL